MLEAFFLPREPAYLRVDCQEEEVSLITATIVHALYDGNTPPLRKEGQLPYQVISGHQYLGACLF